MAREDHCASGSGALGCGAMAVEAVTELAEAPAEVASRAPRRSAVGSVSALVRTLRPQQWIKSLFVAAPLVFARHLGEVAYVWRSALAVLAFCALSGAVYAFNDVRDAVADRLHPTKRHRPIAAGQLS
jgi:decaprenyl-phosphate phosphoribosyltransferase